jgi:hypothetical protein
MVHLQEDQAEATLARASSKHERSAALRDAHLKRIKAKALDETLKVTVPLEWLSLSMSTLGC